MTVVGIVPAGGSGERLGADRPKAFVVCAGRPLVDWSLEVLAGVGEKPAAKKKSKAKAAAAA